MLSVSKSLRAGTIVPVSVPGAYAVTRRKGLAYVRGEYTSGGYTALRFEYHPLSVPSILATDKERQLAPVAGLGVAIPLGNAINRRKLRSTSTHGSPTASATARDSSRMLPAMSRER